LAASWLSPPGITDEKGCVCEGYDRSQRAFVLEAVDDHFSMMLEATKASPLVNPCFVVHKWKKDAELSLKVNGELIPEGLKLRKGINRETDGSWTLVIWLEMQTSEARLMEFGQI
jgi:hypothetical protein